MVDEDGGGLVRLKKDEEKRKKKINNKFFPITIGPPFFLDIPSSS